MLSKFYFISIAVLSVAIGALNFYAYRFFWYWRYWWFDIIMHAMGGLLVGNLVLWFLWLRKNGERMEYRISAAAVFVFAAISIVGVGWELFEFGAKQFIFLPHHNPQNTASDLFFDGVGSAAAVILFAMLYNKKKEIPLS